MAVHLLCLLLIFQVKQCFAWLPKIIWTYWSTPLNSSQISVLLPAFQQNHLRNTQGWQLRHIDSYSMWKWAEEIPNFKAVYNSPEWIGESEAKKSDLLRIALINHFGGLYMDFTTILTQNMDWILDIRTIESIQNKNGKQPDLFLLYSSEHGYKEIYLESGSGQRYLLLPTFESFLMAGKPGNQFCSDWLNFLIETKKLSFQKYKANNKKSMILDIAQSEKIQKGGYKTSYFQVLIAANIVLERKQRLFDLDWKTDLDNTRLLAVKYYNIWVMGTNASAYLGLNFDQETSVLAQTDINFLKQMKLYPPYFLKLNRITMNKIQNFLIKKQQLVTNQTESSEKSSFIIETSLLKVHLLNQKYMKYYANEVIKKQLYLSLCKTEYFIVKVKQIHQKMQKDQIQNFVQTKKLKKQIQLLESSNIKDKSEIQNMKNKIKDYENQRIQLMNKLSEYNQNQKIPQRQQNCQYFNNFYLKMALVIEGIVIICLLILIWRKKTETQNKKNNNQVNLREYESFQLKKQIGDH